MTARNLESTLLARCAVVAREVTPTAQDQREANVFRLAATVVQSQFQCISWIRLRTSNIGIKL